MPSRERGVKIQKEQVVFNGLIILPPPPPPPPLPAVFLVQMLIETTCKVFPSSDNFSPEKQGTRLLGVADK
jgi:hypothetical protein